jgi:hypothetical protein
VGAPRIEDYQVNITGNFKCIAFYAGRLALIKAGDNTIMLSRAPDAAEGTFRYLDFTMETMTETTGEDGAQVTTYAPMAGDAIFLKENDMYASNIQWIAPAQRFIAVSDKASWADTGNVPTPSTFDMNIVEYVGSMPIQGKASGAFVIYAGRLGKSMRALVFQATTSSQGYVDVDISLPSHHLFTAGIKDFAVAMYPQVTLWVVLASGGVVACSVDLQNSMTAFSEHDFSGTVKAVSVSHEPTGDKVWFTIKRGDVYCIETLEMGDLANEDETSVSYVDSTGADTTYPIKSTLVPNTQALPTSAGDTWFGKKRRLDHALLKVYQSEGGQIGHPKDDGTSDDLLPLNYSKLGEAAWDGTPYSGDLNALMSGKIDADGSLLIEHDDNAPFNLLALIERFSLMEV